MKIDSVSFNDVYETIVSISERFGSEIETLEIICCGVGGGGFIEILNLFPNLKSLMLSDLMCFQETPIRNFNELNLTKLQELKIDSCISEFIEVFIDLPENVLVNVFICCRNLKFVEDIFQKQKQIKNLDLSCSVYQSREYMNLDLLNLTHLRYVNKNGATSEFIKILRSQPNLLSLDLTGHKTNYRLLKEIANLKHLSVLKLNVEKLSAEEFLTLKVDSLTELEIEYDHHISTAHITDLSHSKNLKLTSLTLKFYQQHLDAEVLIRLAKNNPNLKLIEIENYYLNELSVCAFLKHCKNLETLRISFSKSDSVINGTFNASFNEKGMENPKLKELKLFGIKLDSEIVLEQMCVNYPNLEVIAFNCATKLSDDDLQHLLQKCTQLRDVELQDCPNLTFNSLDIVMKYGKNIESLTTPSWLNEFAMDIFGGRLKEITFNEEKYGG